jgi:acetylglutamate kinase
VSGRAPVVVKFGGELIEDPSSLAGVVSAIAAVAAAESGPGLVLVHGGGREIDAALKTAGIEKRQIDGLRITDEATLEVVVSVLAGLVNTRLVAALTVAGVRAVGLTGADDGAGLSVVAPRTGRWLTWAASVCPSPVRAPGCSMRSSRRVSCRCLPASGSRPAGRCST